MKLLTARHSTVNIAYVSACYIDPQWNYTRWHQGAILLTRFNFNLSEDK